MGYDLHIVEPTGLTPDRPAVFVENYWHASYAMAREITLGLVDLGIAYELRAPLPPVPDLAPWTGPESYEDVYDLATGELADLRLRAIEHDHLRQTYDERPGIAAYKMLNPGTGYWVTKVECQTALVLWERAGRPDWDLGYGDLEPFLRRAAQYSGFRVW
jgi:hypothetical protein